MPILTCPVCAAANTKIRTHCYQDQLNPHNDREPMGLHDEASCGNKKCWMHGIWIPTKQWNRRQPLDNASLKKEAVLFGVAALEAAQNVLIRYGECRGVVLMQEALDKLRGLV